MLNKYSYSESMTSSSNGHKHRLSWLQQACLSTPRNVSEEAGKDRDITLRIATAFAGLKFAHPCFTELTGKQDAALTWNRSFLLLWDLLCTGVVPEHEGSK